MSNSNNNQLNIPQAREAMDKFKMQAASEVGVNLQSGYNASLTSREAGDLGNPDGKEQDTREKQNFCQRMSDRHGLLLFCSVHISACSINHVSCPGSQ